MQFCKFIPFICMERYCMCTFVSDSTDPAVLVTSSAPAPQTFSAQLPPQPCLPSQFLLSRPTVQANSSALRGSPGRTHCSWSAQGREEKQKKWKTRKGMGIESFFL